MKIFELINKLVISVLVAPLIIVGAILMAISIALLNLVGLGDTKFLQNEDERT